MQGRGMKESGFWKVSLALAWKTQGEDMVLDVEKWKETKVFVGQRGMRTTNGSLACSKEGWAMGSLVGEPCVLSPTDTVIQTSPPTSEAHNLFKAVTFLLHTENEGSLLSSRSNTNNHKHRRGQTRASQLCHY